MSKYSTIAVLAILSKSFLVGQLPEKVSPEIYKVILENDDVKVLKATFKPGASDKLHKHNILTAYVLEGGTMQATDANGKAGKLVTHKKGKAIHIGNELHHRVKNTGNTTLSLLLVEHKKLKSKK